MRLLYKADAHDCDGNAAFSGPQSEMNQFVSYINIVRKEKLVYKNGMKYPKILISGLKKKVD